MAIDVPGVVRLTARYTQDGHPASMTFHFRTLDGSAPVPEDLVDITLNYGLWENTGFLLGYALLRGVPSSYVGCRVNSLDARSLAWAADGPFDRPGEIPLPPGTLLPRGTCPLLHWNTARRPVTGGRTYCVGITALCQVGSSDLSTVNGLYLDALPTIFQQLNGIVAQPVGYQQVHVRYSGRGPSRTLQGVDDITGCGLYERMATQRRRLRPH